MERPLILWFEEIGPEHKNLVGGKGVKLAEMYRELTSAGIPVPNGFVLTTEAWNQFILFPGVVGKLREMLEDINFKEAHSKSLLDLTARMRRVIECAPVSNDVRGLLEKNYRGLEELFWQDVDVAVRSSAVAEDLDDASFAGLHDSYLNIRGIEDVVQSMKHCFGSLFTNRALFYRHEKGFPLFPEDGIAVVVQKMVRSDKACSGVTFSTDPVSCAPYLLTLESVWGLGELYVQGGVNPDTYLFARSLRAGGNPILVERCLGDKQHKLVYSHSAPATTEKVETTKEERSSLSLSEEEALTIARACETIERHFGRPMDIEWAKDGVGGGRREDGDGSIYFVQARAVTTTKDALAIQTTRVKENGTVLVRGKTASPGAGAGRVHVIESAHNLDQFEDGEVLVTRMTDPDWVPAMRKASAIVTNEGGRNCHAAIVARELGVPCIINAKNATEILLSVESVTVSDGGEYGEVMAGILSLEKVSVDLRETLRLKRDVKTKVMLNLADPYTAPKASFYPNDGIGLARMEFIINNIIQMHPLLALHPRPEFLLNAEEFARLKELTAGYSTPRAFFSAKLEEGIMRLARSVWPNPVIVRFSDFKSNEYRRLLGGRHFEPAKEENPMIGWRGASRYYDPRYQPAFEKLECAALLSVRRKGFTNIKVMIPFARTPEEARKTLEVMKAAGLSLGGDGFEVYCMVELPVNVVCLEEFAPFFDGFSIGSNDLTQLTYGIDRDAGDLADIADERHPGVRRLIEMAIRKAHEFGKPIGICGEAPTKFSDYARFLVACGIDSISVQPDAIPATVKNVYDAEQSR